MFGEMITKRYTPEEVKERWEWKISKKAKEKWIDAGRPEGRSDEFWFAAENEEKAKSLAFSRPLEESALPVYVVVPDVRQELADRAREELMREFGW